MNTEVGKIAELLNNSEEKETPLKQKLNGLGKTLGISALVICIIIFVVGVAFGKSILSMFITAISLAVAAIPEGLPAIATIVQAMGVKRLVSKNAIVKKLLAVETLGSATVICSDKTGTLTLNQMTVKEIYLVDEERKNKEEKDIILNKMYKAMVLCNNAKINEIGEEIGDPTETALLKYVLQNDKTIYEEILKSKRVFEVPFDSDKKYMITINETENNNQKINEIYIKGGLDEVLSMCNDIEKIQLELHQKNEKMASKALRVLGYAYIDLSKSNIDINLNDLEDEETLIKKIKGIASFIGISGMIDPPRKEAKTAIEKCKKAGIKTVMITGDHKLTAKAIALELGILKDESEIIEGHELEEMTDEELKSRVMTTSVYTRVSPKHKVRIVKAFQDLGEIVAMTGDGVNDAPALKKADIGCAMGITGTDVSKEAADVIITDDNFATIVSAVEEGRRIYDNILKSIQYLLSSNIGELIVILIAILSTNIISKMFGIDGHYINKLIPLIPIQILWINLVTDTLPALALAEDKAEKDIMKRKPNREKSIFNKNKVFQIIYQGIMMGMIMFTAYVIGLSVDGDTEYKIKVAQTMAFMSVGLGELVHVFNVRSKLSVFLSKPFNNKYLVLAVIVNTGLMLLTMFIPFMREVFGLVVLPTSFTLELTLLIISPLIIVEFMKLTGLNNLFAENKKG